MQSYSAYTPKLADTNANHLLDGSAPRHVFFDVFPMGNRFATLDDGKSWPLLLTWYHLVGRAGRFLVLDRNSTITNAREMEDISTSTERLGHEFKLPKLGAPIWAEIDLRPTFLGQIFAALFKPPQLHITLRYEDGDAESFRYVAAMGRSGFIISPVIHDIYDFAALSTNRRFFSGAWPTSVEIAGDVGTRLSWERTFEVRLRRIELPAQPEAERFIYDEWLYDFPINRKTASFAECSIDAINRKPVTVQPIDPKGHLLVQGWAVVSGENGMAAEEVFVTIMGEDGSFRVARAQIVPRSDVNAYFKHPEMGAAGVQALLDTSDLRGRSKLQIYVKRQSQYFSCPVAIEIRD